jgi:basic amino acid/polyamine antiporter, APA family
MTQPSLTRNLTLFPTTAIVIGAVVGSGIFVSTPAMARALGHGPLVLAAWVIAGLMTLFGAFTQCELVARMPRTGGLYEYLREIYGDEIGFLYGWSNLMIAGSGGIAAVAFVGALYLGEFVTLSRLSPELEGWGLRIPYVGTLYPLALFGTKLVGAAIIIFLTWLNIRGLEAGARLQTISTTSKVLAILAVIGAAFIVGAATGKGDLTNLFTTTPEGRALAGWPFLSAMAAALSGAFWCYDGWGNAAFIGGEVRNPSRTIPRAILLGTFAFIALYLAFNVAYFYIFPIEQIGRVERDRVASAVITALLGGTGAAFVAGLIAFSCFDTTNSSILTLARVYYAMSRDGLFWKQAGEVHPKYRTPHVALLVQGGWSLVLILTGSFELLTSMYVFVNWMLYVLMGLGVFLVRRREGVATSAQSGEYRSFGYPIVPALFVAFALCFVAITLVGDVQAYRAGAQPVIKSALGLALVLTGVPFFLFWRFRKAP